MGPPDEQYKMIGLNLYNKRKLELNKFQLICSIPNRNIFRKKQIRMALPREGVSRLIAESPSTGDSTVLARY